MGVVCVAVVVWWVGVLCVVLGMTLCFLLLVGGDVVVVAGLLGASCLAAVLSVGVVGKGRIPLL